MNSLEDLIHIDDMINGNDNSIKKCINQILIVDDQEFNLNAIEIILKYKLKVNVETTCVRATSG